MAKVIPRREKFQGKKAVKHCSCLFDRWDREDKAEVGEVKGVFMTPLEHGDDISDRIKKTLAFSCESVKKLHIVVRSDKESN